MTVTPDNAPLRIGLYGGSFNPVHAGHLLVAGAALEELQLDRLFLIPAARSPFKPDQTPAPASLRARLLRLAFAGWERCTVDLQEIERGGISFTIDTVRVYRARFPRAELHYLIGADHVRSLPGWRQATELAEMTGFVAIPRPDIRPEPAPPPFRVRWLQGFPTSLSSSEIRNRVRAGQRIDHLVPSAVAGAILEARLYVEAGPSLPQTQCPNPLEPARK